ncbi:uncharacterized protein EDB91DRAFT_1080359 [Suillus paluster]|uniref:uncharacterized protein n=1 Tax=Suillus paluster TaxID=48578 RepID=UPI001B8818D2|nr:uncharacterized protein EDB91DRAFT_1080359 [Suillus paluster]KAG1745447.1 hypothetical protein EDB91DRAFT_1080359 [Suillus paluster]
MTRRDTVAANEESNMRLALRMMDCCPGVHIKVHSLGPDTITYTASKQAVNWESVRAWPDELIPISKRRAADQEYRWTLAENRQPDGIDDGCLSDSYNEENFILWRDIQQERYPSV